MSSIFSDAGGFFTTQFFGAIKNEIDPMTSYFSFFGDVYTLVTVTKDSWLKSGLVWRYIFSIEDFSTKFQLRLYQFTLPETKSWHLKMDGWNTIVSFWDGLLSGANC